MIHEIKHEVWHMAANGNSSSEIIMRDKPFTQVPGGPLWYIGLY